MQSRFAYLSQGKLFVRDSSGTEQHIESQFGSEVARRAAETHRNRQWKMGGEAGMFNRGALWGVSTSDPSRVLVNITAVCPGFKSDDLFYVVETETVGGLFNYNLAEKKETRIFHREGERLRDLRKHPNEDLLICSRTAKSGIANLALFKGTTVDDLTEGDSFDEAPSWLPDGSKQILFQSAGVARNAQGFVVGLGPAAIQKLNLDNGHMDTLAEEPKQDYLLPQQDSQGNLYFIRRPYLALGGQPYSAGTLLKDAICFPYRLGRAVFGFLDVFSMAFSKKPLTAASGPKFDGSDLKTIFLRGRMIDAEKALKEGTRGKGVQSLVPSSWQLVKRSKDGNEEVLLPGTLAFDICGDQSILASNGLAVFHLRPGAAPELVCQTRLVEHLSPF